MWIRFALWEASWIWIRMKDADPDLGNKKTKIGKFDEN